MTKQITKYERSFETVSGFYYTKYVKKGNDTYKKDFHFNEFTGLITEQGITTYIDPWEFGRELDRINNIKETSLQELINNNHLI